MNTRHMLSGCKRLLAARLHVPLNIVSTFSAHDLVHDTTVSPFLFIFTFMFDVHCKSIKLSAAI